MAAKCSPEGSATQGGAGQEHVEVSGATHAVKIESGSPHGVSAAHLPCSTSSSHEVEKQRNATQRNAAGRQVSGVTRRRSEQAPREAAADARRKAGAGLGEAERILVAALKGEMS